MTSFSGETRRKEVHSRFILFDYGIGQISSIRQAGEPYVEMEAIKMIIPVEVPESGKIARALSTGLVILAGDLLASLELKDPSLASQSHRWKQERIAERMNNELN